MGWIVTQNGQSYSWGDVDNPVTQANAARARAAQIRQQMNEPEPERSVVPSAADYVSGLSMAELNAIVREGANLPRYIDRDEARFAATKRLDSLLGTSAQGGAGESGNLVDTDANWTGVYTDGSSAPGYGGTPARGVNEIPLPESAQPLPGGPGVQDPTAPGVTDWGGENLGRDPGMLDADNNYVDGDGFTYDTETGEMIGAPEGGEVIVPPRYPNDPETVIDWNPGEKFTPVGGGGEAPSMDWDWGRFGTQTDTGGFGQYFPNYDASARYSPGEGATWGSDQFPGDNRDFYQNQFGNLIRQSQGFQRNQVMANRLRQEAAENPMQAMPTDWSWTTLPEVEIMESGYAAPVPGQGFGNSSYGYQRGGASYFFDPGTMSWVAGGGSGGAGGGVKPV